MKTVYLYKESNRLYWLCENNNGIINDSIIIKAIDLCTNYNKIYLNSLEEFKQILTINTFF